METKAGITEKGITWGEKGTPNALVLKTKLMLKR